MTFNSALFNVFIPPPPGQPIFYPILDATSAAQVTIPALQQVTGSSSPVQIIGVLSALCPKQFRQGRRFHPAGQRTRRRFGGDKTGGVATPNLNVGGLSRDFGTVSGAGGALDTFAQGQIRSEAVFWRHRRRQVVGRRSALEVIQEILDITGARRRRHSC